MSFYDYYSSSNNGSWSSSACHVDVTSSTSSGTGSTAEVCHSGSSNIVEVIVARLEVVVVVVVVVVEVVVVVLVLVEVQ